MTDATKVLLDALEASGRKIKQTGKDSYVAQCSAHQDGRPSLSIRRGRGQALVFCFAGCSADDIAQGAGLRVSDLFNDPKGVDYAYRVGDELVRRVHRNPDKDFYQSVLRDDIVSLYSPEGQNLKAAVEEGKEVWIPEGEKDCDTLADVDIVATTSPMGAANWDKADWSVLNGASSVVIVADKDEPGIDRARGLYHYLYGLEIGQVRIVTAKVGKDITDHIVAGMKAKDVVSVVADPEFEDQVRKKLRDWEVTEEATARREDKAWARTAQRYQPMSLQEIHDQPFYAPDWVIPDLMERHDRLVLVGPEGHGKSHLLRQMTIMSAAGIYPFDLKQEIEPKRAFVLDVENTVSQWQRQSSYLLNRALEHGKQDPRKTVTVQAGKMLNLLNKRGVDQVHKWIDIHKPDLLVMGPIYKMVTGSLNDEDTMARLLQSFDSFRERGLTLLIEGHAGHSKDVRGDREFRPRGSSMMLGWPEFGLGLKPMSGGEYELARWRGSREERSWPEYVRRGEMGQLPWIPSEGVAA